MQAFITPAAFGSAFTAKTVKAVNASRPAAVVMSAEAKSASMPFLTRPPGLDGTAADVGFDPLRISSLIDIKWLRESEIKHGRICMLAALGFIVQEFVHLPGAVFSNKIAVDAFAQVPAGGLWQIFLFCGLMEFITHKGKLTPLNMHKEGAEPGVFGFDPLGLGKGEKSEWMKAGEIKNGRLAMIAVGGFVHQQWIFKQGIVEQLTHFKPMAIPPL